MSGRCSFLSLNRMAAAGILVFCLGASAVQAYEEAALDTTKIILSDASALGRGHFEISSRYRLQGASKRWGSGGGSESRGYFREQTFSEEAIVGVTDNLDAGIIQGFTFLTDKDQNYDETGGEVDADGFSLDGTEGPHQGYGSTDLETFLNYVFYESPDGLFRLSYLPSVVIPTGRRSNLDHLGPSQGYVSLGNLLAATRDFSCVSITANAGYSAPLGGRRRAGEEAGTLMLGGGAGYLFRPWLQPQMEWVYEHSFENDAQGAKTVYAAFGVIMPVRRSLRLEAGYVQAVAGRGSDQTASAVFKIVLIG